jgi:hypothetical protein
MANQGSGEPKDRNIESFGGTDVTGRDIAGDLQAIVDDSIKGLMRSIGDVGSTPANTTGYTVLERLKDISSRLQQIRNSYSSQTASNTSTGAGLTVDIDLSSYSEGRSRIEVVVKSSAAADFTVQGSLDNSNWWDVDTISLAASGEEHQGYFNAFPYVRVTTSDANDNEIYIAASG